MEPESIVCPSCRAPIPLASAKYCPYCGKLLRVGISVADQAIVYFVSLLLPPLGFWYTYKYLRLADPKAKRIGWIATILTVISLVAAIWIGKATLDAVNRVVQPYTNIGF